MPNHRGEGSAGNANAAYLGLFISGIASAATAPYLSTVGLDILGLSGTQYSVIVFVSGILAIVMSLSVGWLSDRIAGRRRLIAILAATASLGIGAFVLFGNLVLFVLCCLIFLPLTSILTQQFFAYLREESRHLDKLATENRNARGRTVSASAWVATPLVFLMAPSFDPANLAFITSAIACLVGAIAFSPIFGPNMSDTSAPLQPSSTKVDWRTTAGACRMLAIPLLACAAPATDPSRPHRDAGVRWRLFPDWLPVRADGAFGAAIDPDLGLCAALPDATLNAADRLTRDLCAGRLFG